MNDKCWLVVGGGNMGMRHCEHLRSLYSNATIILVSTRKVNSIDASFVVNSIELALEYKPSFAIITNAAPHHCEVAEVLIQKGIHILIEKPLSDTYQTAVNLLRLALLYPAVVVLVGYQLRYKPGFEHIQGILKNEMLGRLFYAKASIGHYLPLWRPQNYAQTVSSKKSLGGGVLLELSHEYDYLKAIFSMPDKITCEINKVSDLEIDVEDIAFSIFHYPSGFLVHLSQNMVDQPPHRNLEIRGEKGFLKWDLRDDKIEVYDVTGKTMLHQYESTIKTSRELYLKQIRHFVECINGKESPKVTLEDACETMMLIELAKKSAQKKEKGTL